MYSVGELSQYVAKYDGYKLQGYLLENIDLIGYVASFYLVFVGKGKPILRWLCGRRRSSQKESPSAHYSPAALNRFFFVSCVYHVLVAALACACATNLLPTLLRAFEEKQAYTTLCAWNDNLIYNGPMGFWVSVCVFAKIVDLVDSCLLVVRDYMTSEMSSEVQTYVGSMRQLTAAHWWFRCLVALFWWHTFSIGISTFPALALVDAAFHVVIHSAHIGADLLSFVPTSLVKGHGKSRSASVSVAHKLLNLVSTLALLSECIVCTAVAVYSSYMNYTAPEGCHVVQANVRMCVCVFVGTIVLAVARLSSAKQSASKAVADVNGSSKGATPSKPRPSAASKAQKKQ